MTENYDWKREGIDGKEPFFLKRVLVLDKEKRIKMNVLKLDPNTEYPHHSHKVKEWVYILEGDMKDQNGDYQKGSLLVNEQNSEHQVKSGQNGTEILVIKGLEEDE